MWAQFFGGSKSKKISELTTCIWINFLSDLSAFRALSRRKCDVTFQVKEFAWLNWQAYISDKPQVTEGQILPYPLNVMEDGRLEYLEPIGSWQGKTFPDFRSGSNIKGTLSTLIPQKVTT